MNWKKGKPQIVYTFLGNFTGKKPIFFHIVLHFLLIFQVTGSNCGKTEVVPPVAMQPKNAGSLCNQAKTIAECKVVE